MLDINSAPLFFLGANAPGGFISKFSDVYSLDGSWRSYIIKGGPGTGKSTLMRKAAKAAMSHGIDVELAPCSSDPGSLDGVIMPKLKCVILDGTAPHIIEPCYIGACERQLSISDCLDCDLLEQNAKEIIEAFVINKRYHERASRYISAAGTLLSDNCKLVLECTDTIKAVKFGAQLAEREIPFKKGGKPEEAVRFMSGVTPLGLVFYESNFKKLADRTVIISDEYGAASRMIMAAIKVSALERGHSIITCLCPFSPAEKIDHIFIPELRLCFTVSNSYHSADSESRIIHARRFMSATALRTKKQRLSFNKRAAKELIISASEVLSDAKASHDRLESLYTPAVDFAAVGAMTDRVIEEILLRNKK